MATETTKITYVEGAAASTPAGSRVVVYAKADGLMYSKDDAGAETLMSSGSSGNVATDAIWDAKGDLAVGTGANTAAKLTVGANDTIPMADSGETTGIKWVASQTPSTQAFSDAAAQGTADTYARGDHKHGMPASPSASITSATADQSADVTLSADTIADATGASISLAAGTWLVLGDMCISTTNGAAIYCLMAITDGSNAKVFEARLPVSSASPVSLSGHAIVTPGSTTTYKLRGQAAGGGTTKIIKNPEGGSEIGTRISAIQLA